MKSGISKLRRGQVGGDWMHSEVSVRSLDTSNTQLHAFGWRSRLVPSRNRLDAAWVATLRLVLAVLRVLVGTSANADEPARQWALEAPPTYTPRFDWSGFYVAGHVAYGRGHASNTCSIPTLRNQAVLLAASMAACRWDTTTCSHPGCCSGSRATSPFPLEDGLIFGRATAQGTNVTDQIDYIGTVRGRVGYAFDHWLIYGTGGFAGARRASRKRRALAVTRTLCCPLARAGPQAWEPRSQSRRIGPRGSSICTTTLEA